MIKKSIVVLAALSLAMGTVILAGCAANDPANWERSERGLAPHPDDDPTERRTR